MKPPRHHQNRLASKMFLSCSVMKLAYPSSFVRVLRLGSNGSNKCAADEVATWATGGLAEMVVLAATETTVESSSEEASCDSSEEFHGDTGGTWSMGIA